MALAICVTKCGVKKAFLFKPRHLWRGETLSRTFMTLINFLNLIPVVGSIMTAAVLILLRLASVDPIPMISSSFHILLFGFLIFVIKPI